MKQFEKIKKEITECKSAIEMVGYLDGLNAAAIIYCKRNHPDEVYIIESGESKISIYGMKYFLESEADVEDNKYKIANENISDMCKYCNPMQYEDNYYGTADFDMNLEISNGGWTNLYMLWNSKTNKFGICAMGDSEAATNINFCPKCGRKL